MTEVNAETIKQDRARRKLSRVKYGEMFNTTHTRVYSLEKGTKPTDEELAALQTMIDGSPTPPEIRTKRKPAIIKPKFTPTPPMQVERDAVILLDEQEEEDNDEGLGVGPEEVQGTLFDEIAVGAPVVIKYQFELPGYHISNSELKTFKRCRRKWYLAYYRELRMKSPEMTGPRQLGTRIHLALSALYSVEDRQDPMEVLEQTITHDRERIVAMNEGSDNTEALTNLEKEADLARAMLEGYIDWIAEHGVDEGLEIIGNEEIVEVPFTTYINTETGVETQVVLIGKMDIRIRRTIDHARFFLDHKTVANLTTPTKTLHLDEQMLMYHLLEYLKLLEDGITDEMIEHAAGGIYNMLRKVKRTATANPPFYGRVEVRHNIHELRSFYKRVLGEVHDIMELRQRLDENDDHRQVAYPNPTNDCSWDCDFIAVCPMFDDGSAAEELLVNYYEHGDPHDHYRPFENERSEA